MKQQVATVPKANRTPQSARSAISVVESKKSLEVVVKQNQGVVSRVKETMGSLRLKAEKGKLIEFRETEEWNLKSLQIHPILTSVRIRRTKLYWEDC